MNQISFRKRNLLGLLLYYVLCFAPVPFLLVLLNYWLSDRIYIRLAFQPVDFYEDADTVVQEDLEGASSITAFGPKLLQVSAHTPETTFLAFELFGLNYVFLEDEQTFVNVAELFGRQPASEIIEVYESGRPEVSLPLATDTYGFNEMIVSPPSITHIIFDSMFSVLGIVIPITFVCCLLDNNYLYTTSYTILVVWNLYKSISGAFDDYRATLNHVSTGSFTIVIRRNEKGELIKKSVASRELVPGDVIEITNGLSLSTDVMLINGSCIISDKSASSDLVDELKVAPTARELEGVTIGRISPKFIVPADAVCTYVRCSIKETVLALVLATGYNTKKGIMIREFLTPKGFSKEVFNEAVNLVFLLLFVAVLGVATFLSYVINYKGPIQMTSWTTFLWCKDLVLAIVNPMLPYCIFMGVSNSKSRLESREVTTSNAKMIVQCAKIRAIFYEKAGALTDEVKKIDEFHPNEAFDAAALGKGAGQSQESQQTQAPMYGRIMNAASFKKMFRAGDRSAVHSFRGTLMGGLSSTIYPFETETSDMTLRHPIFAMCLALCNTLVSVSHHIFGTEIDTQLLERSPYELLSGTNSATLTEVVKTYSLRPEFAGTLGLSSKLEVIREMEYLYELKMCSVVIRNEEGEHFVVSRGALEEISMASNPDSLPTDITQQLFNVAMKGLGVMAYGIQRIAPEQVNLPRHLLERNLLFLGFVTNQSKLRENVPEVVDELSRCQISQLIVSNDNLFAATSIAQKSGIVSANAIFYFCLEDTDEQDPERQLLWLNFNQIIEKQSKSGSERSPAADLTSKHMPDLTYDVSHLMAIEGRVCLGMNADVFFLLRDRLVAENSTHSLAVLKFLQTNCLVFARANPSLKRRLINEYKAIKEKNSQVLFVGTDPNDAEAIEAADISLLMKKSHLSFKATFTANDSNFDSVAGIIREGKCSTESGFLTFKFFIFVSSLQLYRFYILGHFFMGYSNQMVIVVDFLVNLFIIEYITVFRPKPRLDPAENLQTIYNRRFFLNLAAHCLSGFFVLVTAYEEMRDLSYYREPFRIIPYQDQLDLNIDLGVHKIYEGTLFFFLEVLLIGIFFLITNFRSFFRVPLTKQHNAFVYILLYVAGFGWTAMLSSKDEPSWFEQKFINYFNSPKTYKTNEIYLRAILIYCFLGVMIEQFSSVVYSYFDQLAFARRKPHFIQCEVEEAEPVQD